VITGGQLREDFSRIGPVAEVRNKNAIRLTEVPFQPFDYAPMRIVCASVKFGEHYRAEPKQTLCFKPARCQNCLISLTQRGNVDRSVEKGEAHLWFEIAEHVVNLNATLEKALMSFPGQTVTLFFGEGQIESTIDGFRLGRGA